jgi:hypothetical protein
VELVQAPVVGDGDVTVPLAEGDGGVPGDTVVGDPHDEIDEPLLPAGHDLLEVADAADDLGVGQRLPEQQAGVVAADLVADPVPEVAVLVPGAVGLRLGDAQVR